MKVIALDTHDDYREGDVYEVAEHRAAQLIAKGLVKAGPVPLNKMAPPGENKDNPIPAAGEARIASLSQAAQALPVPISVPLNAGDSASLSREEVRAIMFGAEFIEQSGLANETPEPPQPKRRGRPPKNRDASSP